jgi:hypothetical protein
MALVTFDATCCIVRRLAFFPAQCDAFHATFGVEEGHVVFPAAADAAPARSIGPGTVAEHGERLLFRLGLGRGDPDAEHGREQQQKRQRPFLAAFHKLSLYRASIAHSSFPLTGEDSGRGINSNQGLPNRPFHTFNILRNLVIPKYKIDNALAKWLLPAAFVST